LRGEGAAGAAGAVPPAGSGPGLYLHWPFCAAKCPYCDFNSHVSAAVDTARWQRAYLAEIDRVAAELPGWRVGSVFFGGGTPSLMPPGLVAALLDRVAARWPVAPDMEVTLEANPGSVEAGRLVGWRAAGVNRVSLGVQALDDGALRALGRQHSAAEARAAVALAQRLFERVSFDLICARQGQSPAAWRAELHEALAIAGEHLSVYQLTIEPGTVFARRAAAGRLPGLQGEDPAVEMFEATQELCAAAGLPAYEISNHARPGAECRHNLAIWQGGAYAGIGPGAHGRIEVAGARLATEAARGPDDWLARVERKGSGEALRQTVPPAEAAVEYALGALRTAAGIDLDRLGTLDDRTLDPSKVQDLQDIGVIESGRGRLWLTDAGRLVLDSVLAALLAGPQGALSGQPSESR
jgi:putative oxygen-independent coproporphyrinogen III oxidase